MGFCCFCLTLVFDLTVFLICFFGPLECKCMNVPVSFGLCFLQVLQDLGLPTASESKSDSSSDTGVAQESVNAAPVASTTSEDVCARVVFIIQYIVHLFVFNNQCLS